MTTRPKRTGKKRETGYPGARRAFNPDRLLEREDPFTTHVEDVRHYIRIYQELLAFKHGLLERASQSVGKLSAETRRELSVTDLPALTEQLRRLNGRLAFWYGRLWALQGFDMDRTARTVTHRGTRGLLTRREFDLLEYLIKHPLRYTPAAQLIQGAWGGRGLSEEQQRTYVARLRKRIKDLDLPCRLANEPRRGYSLVFERLGAPSFSPPRRPARGPSSP